VVSRCTAAASPASGILVVAKARQLSFVDLAAAATAALALSQSKVHCFLVAALTPVCCLTALRQSLACFISVAPAMCRFELLQLRLNKLSVFGLVSVSMVLG